MPQSNINLESMLPIGTVLRDTYRVDGYLSSGGFGNTYVISHLNFNEVYAIKEFYMKSISNRDVNRKTVNVNISENINSFREQLEKFKIEARRMRILNNKHIVKVHDLFEENGTAYYVMDYVNGVNLSQYLRHKGNPLKEDRVIEILYQILDALQEIHSKNIWHLDLKPANIMVDSNEIITLIDFGASKQLNVLKGGATTGTSVSYTNGYAPREQMEQKYEKFGPWTDFYALGATLYYLLTYHQPPMPTDIDDDLSLDKHLALPFPNNVSIRTRQLVLWLMRTNRADRPQNVKEIITYVNQGDGIFKKDDFVSAKEETELVQPIGNKTIDQTVSLPNDTKSQKAYENHPKKMSLSKIIIGVASVFLLLAIGLFIFKNTQSISTPQESRYDGNTTDNPSITKDVTEKEIVIPLGSCTYTGEVNVEGVPNGRGQAWFKDGRYYKGYFVNGNLHGDNAYFSYKEGDVFEGSFKNNEFDQGLFTVKSTGEYFRGSFSENNPLHGQWYDKNGHLLEAY